MPVFPSNIITSVEQAEVDFANSTGPVEGDTATATILSAAVTTSSKFVCTVQGGTADHDYEDAALEGITAYVTNIVAGVSFDVVAYAPNGTWGRYYVNVTFN